MKYFYWREQQYTQTVIMWSCLFGDNLMGSGSANDATSDDGGMASVVSL